MVCVMWHLLQAPEYNHTLLSVVHAITIQPDSKILIVGDIMSYNTVATNNIARLNADGTLDTTFATSVE